MKASRESLRQFRAVRVALLMLAVGAWGLGCGAPQDSEAYRSGSEPAAGAQSAAAAWTITEAQREAMLNVLLTDGESHPVWFSTDVRDQAAQKYQTELADVFAQAGWEIRGNRPTPFAMKPGLYFFVADIEPPDYVVSAQAAFDAAGIAVSGGSGYRGYYREQKEQDPNWQGFALAEDQTFLIVVGRRPVAESI